MGPFNMPRKMSQKARMWKENRRAAKPVKLPPIADRRFPSTRAGRGQCTGRFRRARLAQPPPPPGDGKNSK